MRRDAPRPTPLQDQLRRLIATYAANIGAPGFVTLHPATHAQLAAEIGIDPLFCLRFEGVELRLGPGTGVVHHRGTRALH